MRQFGDYDLASVTGAAGVPIRAINSAVYPTNVEGNREIAADFDVRILEGVGHFPMLVVPDELNAVLLEVVTELSGA